MSNDGPAGEVILPPASEIHKKPRRKARRRNKAVESGPEPAPKVRIRRGKVECDWCRGRGCSACFTARESVEKRD
jgi:hypothetical protein